MRSAPIDLLLAQRNLLRQPRRSAIAIAAVTAGIVALMLAGGFIEWIFHDMRESTIHAHVGHVQVVRPGYHEAGASDPNGYLLPGRGAALDLIARQPHVEVVAPRLVFSGLASHGDVTVSFVGEGVDPRSEVALSRALNIVEGTQLGDGDADGAILGVGLARNLGVKVGDLLVLVVNRRGGGIGAVETRVRGLFSTITKAFDDSVLRVPISTARKLVGVDGAHMWVILLDDTGRTDAVAAALRAQLPRNEFDVVPWYDLADFYRKTVALFSKQVHFVAAIIAVIIVLSISNTMMMCIMERTAEIGTALALGTRRHQILRRFVTEGTLIGLLGGVVGLALGWTLAMAISAVGIPMPPPPGMEHGFIGQIRITPALAAEAFALAVATTLLASVYPAWKASRLEIVDALRHSR